MKHLVAAFIALSPAVSVAQYQDPQAVVSATQQVLAKVSALEAAAGKKENAVIFKRLLKRSTKISLYWGYDVANLCKRSEAEGVTYAYTVLDPVVKQHRYINICPYAVEQATGIQMVYVLLHELAHQWGIKDEGEANFVANRAFSLMGWGDPFLYKDAREYLNHYASISPQLKKQVDEIFALDPTLELFIPILKASPQHWSEALQAYDGRPYKQLGDRNSAQSVHRFFRLGDLVWSKTRVMTK